MSMWSRRTTLYPEKSSRVQGNLEEAWTFNNPDLTPSLGAPPKSELPSHGLLTTSLQKDWSWGEHSCNGWLWLLVMGCGCSRLLQRWQSVKLSIGMVFVCRLLRDNELEVFQSWVNEGWARKYTRHIAGILNNFQSLKGCAVAIFSLLWVPPQHTPPMSTLPSLEASLVRPKMLCVFPMLLDLFSCPFSYPAKDTWHPKSDTSPKRRCFCKTHIYWHLEVVLLDCSIDWTTVPQSPCQLDIFFFPSPRWVTFPSLTSTANSRSWFVEFFSAPAPFSAYSESLSTQHRGPDTDGPWTPTAMDQPHISQSTTPQLQKLRGDIRHPHIHLSLNSKGQLQLQELSEPSNPNSFHAFTAFTSTLGLGWETPAYIST